MPCLWEAVNLCLLLYRSDCLRLLSHCTNSSVTNFCDLIAPSSSEARCISLDQFLKPSMFGSDVVSTLGDMIHNPCEPNPCTEGYFCSINRMCHENQGCTPFECQPGCVVGTSPGIVLPRSEGVRVSMVDEYGCHGYINCSAVSEDLCECLLEFIFYCTSMLLFIYSVQQWKQQHQSCDALPL